MKTIYKYPLLITDSQVIRMPAGARILCCQMQTGGPAKGDVCLWAEVDTDRPHVNRTILIAGTGNPFPEKLPEKRSYIGSVQDGVFVWHVYEGTE